jgi:hypothetical protein
VVFFFFFFLFLLFFPLPLPSFTPPHTHSLPLLLVPSLLRSPPDGTDIFSSSSLSLTLSLTHSSPRLRVSVFEVPKDELRGSVMRKMGKEKKAVASTTR